MNTKKYEFVDGDTIEFKGTTLRRIRALRDIPEFNVKAGDLGGYLAEESSLSQDNNSWIEKHVRIGKNAWIGENSWIGENVWFDENSWISENAWISGNAWISENAWFDEKRPDR